MTESGYACTFPTEIAGKEMSAVEQSTSANEADNIFLNLNDRKHRADKRPLLESCACYTCKHHTRAYLHHLLNTQEMLVDTLLNIHNTSHMQNFFDSIQRSIQTGKFDALSSTVRDAFQS
eukprot:TRINITY_DN8344_c0_g1_i1.p1 TRINITY_DN8344_c0_g1~~TRINITY_DN8344_c0_g1_i1.p1  ORF type:complete len:120 (+),score=15.44 TRINITY_DN8344_c0_g1_i1:156-515(+)